MKEETQETKKPSSIKAFFKRLLILIIILAIRILNILETILVLAIFILAFIPMLFSQKLNDAFIRSFIKEPIKIKNGNKPTKQPSK